jgi:Recombination endonuclease VII
MLISDEPTDRPAEPGSLCGRWMPRKRTACARRTGHQGECRSAEALTEKRQRKTARRVGVRVADDPAVRARWNKAHRFVRLGMSEDQFNEMLAAQGYACAICREPFGERRRICADHDHGCCPEQDGRWAKTCGQ